MSHQNPLSEELDVYDDSQNLLDIVPDGPTDDDILYDIQLRAALDASLSATESRPIDTAQPQEALDIEELEEVYLATQLQEIMSQQHEHQAVQQQHQTEVSTIRKTVNDDLQCDSPSVESQSSDEERSEELLEVINVRRNAAGLQSDSQVARQRRQRRKLRRAQKRRSQETDTTIDDEDINPELAEVLKMSKENTKTSDVSVQVRPKHRHDRVRNTNIPVQIEPRLQPSPLNDNGIPNTWDCEANNLDGISDYTLVRLSAGDAEYDAICHEFAQVSLEVIDVERLQNFILLDRYRKEREHMCDSRQPGFDINEQYLYHGTKNDKTVICEEYLDQRLARKGHFGRGIYYSDNPRKCLQYVENSETTTTFQILKCRVILGDTKVYPKGESDSNLKREPRKEAPSGGWKYYDSVKGCPRDFNEFVIYDSRRAITEFIITLKKSDEEPKSASNHSTTTGVEDNLIPPSIPEEESNTTDGSGLTWVQVPARTLNNSNDMPTVASSEENSSTIVVSYSENGGLPDETGIPNSAISPSPSANKEQGFDTLDDGNASGYDSDSNSVSSCYSTASESEELNGKETWTDIHGNIGAPLDGMSPDNSHNADKSSSLVDSDGQALGASGVNNQNATSQRNSQQPASAVNWQLDDEEAHNEKVKRVREEMRQKREQERRAGKQADSGMSGIFFGDTGTGAASLSYRGPQATLHIGSSSAVDPDDPVNQVLSGLISEFLQITEIDSIETARRFIIQADQDLNLAIVNYYNSIYS